jgi:hypothetical protein
MSSFSKKLNLSIIIVGLFFIPLILSGQSKSNLDLVYDLIDNSINEISFDQINESHSITLNYISPPDLDILKNRIILNLEEISSKLVTESEQADLVIDYTVDEVDIKYNSTFKDGFFGSYMIERQAFLHGSYYLSFNNNVTDANQFHYTIKDTVNRDEIKDLENPGLPFTHDEVPYVPFFSSILVPAIAIGATAVAIFLLFTVRSK